jgi:hypothetical protein
MGRMFDVGKTGVSDSMDVATRADLCGSSPDVVSWYCELVEVDPVPRDEVPV